MRWVYGLFSAIITLILFLVFGFVILVIIGAILLMSLPFYIMRRLRRKPRRQQSKNNQGNRKLDSAIDVDFRVKD